MAYNRMAIKPRLMEEQRHPGLEDAFTCVWCGLPGGDKRPDNLYLVSGLAGVEHWDVLDMHEWFIKRGRAADDVVFSPINTVLAHHHCHIAYGNTKIFKDKCAKHKAGLGYKVREWIINLLTIGAIKVLPDMEFIKEEMEAEPV